MSTKTNSKSKQIIIDSINWSEVETSINAGGFKIKTFAEAKGWSQASLKEALVEHFGDNIVFKRGRTGGVFINEAK
jgi:hypothetical protein